jgi:hypothetical protein
MTTQNNTNNEETTIAEQLMQKISGRNETAANQFIDEMLSSMSLEIKETPPETGLYTQEMLDIQARINHFNIIGVDLLRAFGENLRDYEGELIDINKFYAQLTDHELQNTENVGKWIQRSHWALISNYCDVVLNEEEDLVLTAGENIELKDNCEYCECVGEYYHRDEIRWSENSEEWLPEDDAVYSRYHESYILHERATHNDSVNDWYEDESEYDFLNYHGLNDDDEDECHDQINRLNEYHSSPTPTKINERIESKGWWVGFEVEKSYLKGDDDEYLEEGDEIEICNFFSGWEKDSSCGVEGISNIYNLSDTVTFTKDLEEACYIDNDVSKNCGGHISISYMPENYEFSNNILVTETGDIKQVNTYLLSSYMGLIYAMYPKRLERSYCNTNKKLQSDNGNKYQPVRDSGSRIEIRLFSAVKNSTTLKNRFKFLQSFLPAIEKAEKRSEPDKLHLLVNTPRLPRSISETTLKLVEAWDDNLISKINFGYNPYYRYAKYILNECWDVLNEIYADHPKKDERLAAIIIHTYAFTNYLKTDAYPNNCIKQYLCY